MIVISPSEQAADKFCELLKAEGDEAGTTLSSLLNIPRTTVWRWKQRIDSVDKIGMLADYFGVPIEEFFTTGERQ